MCNNFWATVAQISSIDFAIHFELVQRVSYRIIIKSVFENSYWRLLIWTCNGLFMNKQVLIDPLPCRLSRWLVASWIRMNVAYCLIFVDIHIYIFHCFLYAFIFDGLPRRKISRNSLKSNMAFLFCQFSRWVSGRLRSRYWLKELMTFRSPVVGMKLAMGYEYMQLLCS